MVSARLVDYPEEPDDGDIGSLPDMMFAPGEEPVGVRVLTYQSSSALKRIFNALDDDELDFIRRSAFGKLIDIAEKPVFSGRFARYLLSRQLKTKKKYELWFRFAGNPIRFALREFAIVTGLPCGKYPAKSKMKLKKTISAQSYWPSLFGKVEVVPVSSVIKMLYRKTVKDKEIRIKYACLALLESVLLPTSLKMKISRDHAEAIADLDDFFSYPWGRLAFEMLIGSIKERDEVALSQNTIAVKGFALALQLVLVEAVPALSEGVQELCSSSESESDDGEGIGRDIFAKKNTLNPSHARNVDKRSNVKVSCLIRNDTTQNVDDRNLGWSDEEPDSKIDNLLCIIDTNYEFTHSLFGGGLRRIDVERMRETCKSTTKARKATYGHGHLLQTDASKITSDVIETIKPRFDNMENKFKLACRTADAIEGKVVVHVKQMLDTFKAELMVSVKDMVATMCKETVHTAGVVCNQHFPAPVTLPVTSTEPADDVDRNAENIANVLRNISDYSTPPRSTPMSQDENVTTSKKELGASGCHRQTEAGETYAQSENSQNRNRQNCFQQRLAAHKLQSENLGSEPSFSLGLTQDEQIEGEDRLLTTEGRHQDCTSQTNVVDNNDEGQGSRKSKRQKTVPSGLVADYQCGRDLMSRVQEAQKFVFGTDDQSEMRRKYGNLCVKLGQPFVLNVGGIAVATRDIQQLVERPRLLTAKVIDILMRVARYVVSPNLPPQGQQSATFLDTKFVVAINRIFPKFLKSRSKESYKFPKGLSDIFPCKDGPLVHPIRYYFPFNLGMKHWVGICFDARLGVLTVLDCNTNLFTDRAVDKFLKCVIQLLPYLARYVGLQRGEEPVMQCYDVVRPKYVAQNRNPSDSGLMAVILMARHAVKGLDGCKNISPASVDEEARRAAIMAYELNAQL